MSVRLYTPEQYERKRLVARAWYYAHREYALERSRVRRRTYQRPWHPDEKRWAHNAYMRRRTAAIAAAKAWRQAHPVEAAHSASTSRARRMAAPGSHTAQEWREKVALFGGCCAYCGRSDRPLTRDHRLPLIRGGTHDIENIVPACGPCNSSKQHRTDTEFVAALYPLGQAR